MKKTITLKKNYEFNYIFKKGKYLRGKVIECFYIKHEKNINYIGIAISSKICNAVQRNKMKRRIREAYLKFEEDMKTGHSFVFLFKKKVNIEEATFQQIYQDMEKFLKNIGIINNE